MKAEFYYDKRRYTCSLSQEDSLKELRIRNYQGFVLAVKQGETIGLLGKKREDAIELNVSQPRFYNLIKAATNALKLEDINQALLDKDQLIANIEQIINKKDQQLGIFNQKLTLLNKQLDQLSGEQQQQLEALELENQKLE